MNLQVVKPEAAMASLLQTVQLKRTECTIGNADIVKSFRKGGKSNNAAKVSAGAAVVSAAAAVVSAAVAVISLKVKSKDLLICEAD